MWKQQKRVLTAGTLVVRKDYRMRLRDDFSLELSELKPDDQGTYTCEIDVMGKPISITHKVQKWQVIFAFFKSRNFCCDFDGRFRTVCEVAFLMIFKHCVVLKLWNWFFLTPEPDSWKRGVSAKDRKGGKCQSFFLLICQESTFPNTRCSGQLGSFLQGYNSFDQKKTVIFIHFRLRSWFRRLFKPCHAKAWLWPEKARMSLSAALAVAILILG